MYINGGGKAVGVGPERLLSMTMWDQGDNNGNGPSGSRWANGRSVYVCRSRLLSVPSRPIIKVAAEMVSTPSMVPAPSAANTLNNSANPIPNSILYTAAPVTTTIAGLTGSGVVNLAGQVHPDHRDQQHSSSFSGSFGANAATGIGTSLSSITISGGTTLTLSGSSSASFVSPITIQNGTLQLPSTATGNAPINVGDGVTGLPAFLSARAPSAAR